MATHQSARRFQFLREIAAGGFGSVFLTKVMHADGFSRLVAVKLLHRRWSENEEVARRMRDEARLLGWLRHRNIVEVFDLTSLDGRAAVIMEYLEAVDLKLLAQHLADRNEAVPPRSALEIMACVASALDAAYNRPPFPGEKPLRVIHRDIKPSNIMIDESGLVKVLDFGVARADFESRESHTRELQFGSVDYMPPERLFFEPETPASDVYSLASSIFEIMVVEKLGKARGRPEKHTRFLADRFSFMRAVLSLPNHLADEMEQFFTACLSYEYSERPSAADVAQRARELGRKIGGLDLREWAEAVVPPMVRLWEAEPREHNPLIDTTISEDTVSLGEATPPPPDTAQTIVSKNDPRWEALRQAALNELRPDTNESDEFEPSITPVIPVKPLVAGVDAPSLPFHMGVAGKLNPADVSDMGTVLPPGFASPGGGGAPPNFSAPPAPAASFGVPPAAGPSFGAAPANPPSFGAAPPAGPSFGAAPPAGPSFGAAPANAPSFGASPPAAPSFGARPAAPPPSFVAPVATAPPVAVASMPAAPPPPLAAPPRFDAAPLPVIPEDTGSTVKNPLPPRHDMAQRGDATAPIDDEEDENLVATRIQPRGDELDSVLSSLRNRPDTPAYPTIAPSMDDWSDVPTRIELNPTLDEPVPPAPPPPPAISAVPVMVTTTDDGLANSDAATIVGPSSAGNDQATQLLAGGEPAPRTVWPPAEAPPPPPKVAPKVAAKPKPRTLPAWLIYGVVAVFAVGFGVCLGGVFIFAEDIRALIGHGAPTVEPATVSVPKAAEKAPESAPEKAAPAAAPAGPSMHFISLAADTRKITVTCSGGAKGSGAGDAYVEGAAADKCSVTAILAGARLTAVVSGATQGEYRCFADGENRCVR